MSTIRMEMTIATIGRFMKNFDIDQRGCGFGVAGIYGVLTGAVGVPPADFSPKGTGFTSVPSRTFWVPSATTLSPALMSPEITQSEPTRSPAVTARMLTLL